MLIICSSKHSQLANKLIIALRFFVWGELNSVKIFNPSFAPYAKYFENPTIISPSYKSFFRFIDYLGDNARTCFSQLFHHFASILAKLEINNRIFAAIDIGWDRKCDIDNKDFLSLAKQTKFLFVTGWQFTQGNNQEADHSKIVETFKPKNIYLQRAQLIIDNARTGDSNRILLGVHIRQGDYKTFEKGRFFFETEDYVSIVSSVVAQFSNVPVTVIICSNEAQNEKLFAGLNYLISEEEALCDLIILSLCDYIIGPPSTFSHLASCIGKVPRAEIRDSHTPPSKSSFLIEKL